MMLISISASKNPIRVFLASQVPLPHFNSQFSYFSCYFSDWTEENDRQKKTQPPWGVDLALQNTESPEEKIGGAFPATPPLPWDSFQSSDWNHFSRMWLSSCLPSFPPSLPKEESI